LHQGGANLAKPRVPRGLGGQTKGKELIMAKEIKSISVAPSAEEYTINLWQSFGWEFRTTSGKLYVKLTFERDPARQNYAELKSLEEQYYNVKDPPHYTAEPKRFGCISLIIYAFFLLFGFAGFVTAYRESYQFTTEQIIISWLIPIFIFSAGIVSFVLESRSYSKKKKLWDEAYDVYRGECESARKKRQELLEKAKSLA
jgi:hypothetical protein